MIPINIEGQRGESMLYKLSNFFACVITRKSHQSAEKMSVLAYGFEIILSHAFTSIVIIFIGLIVERGVESLLFLGVFMGLRLYCGGYHAETYIKCFLSSVLLYILVMVLSDSVIVCDGYSMLLGVGGIASGVIIIKAPVVNINHPVSGERRRINRKKALIILFCIDLIVILCMGYKILIKEMVVVVMSKILVAVLILLGCWKGSVK